MLKNILSRYQYIESSIKKIIAAQFCLQAINTSFFLLLNYFMVASGYEDYEAAHTISYRFFAVFFLAFPIGLFIKGRRLMPFFYAATILVPISSIIVIWAIDQHMPFLVSTAMMTWGIGYTCIQITILPFILLNAKPENHSEAISLSFLSFSATLCTIGLLYKVLVMISPDFFTEKNVLYLISALSGLGLYFVATTKIKEKVSTKLPLVQVIRNYEWKTIFKAVIPSFIIAVGAGFTIPVINLFFLKVHGVSSDTFSIIGSMTFFLVAVVMLFMPTIKRRFGYRIAITLFQSLAVLTLFLLATTEYYKEAPYAVYVAFALYIIRQPLMSAAAPMTSELALYFVGKKNQEIFAALHASLWAGSWYVSMKIFQWLRMMEYRYVTIFLITVGLYIVGVSWYAYLIRSYRKKTGHTGKAVPVPEAPSVREKPQQTIREKIS